MMDDALEPGCTSGGTRRDAVGERLAEYPPGAVDGGTPEPADLYKQVDRTAARREVRQPSIVPAMDLRRPSAALGAGCIGSGWPGHDQQTVRLGGDGLNQETSRRYHLE